jgi:hypothetical protein
LLLSLSEEEFSEEEEESEEDLLYTVLVSPRACVRACLPA